MDSNKFMEKPLALSKTNTISTISNDVLSEEAPPSLPPPPPFLRKEDTSSSLNKVKFDKDTFKKSRNTFNGLLSDSDEDEDDEDDDDEEKSKSESGSSVSSVYSTDDIEVRRQRKKEKELKKRCSRTSYSEIDDEQGDNRTINSATVGTSKVSDTSFRAIKNLEKLVLPLAPYIRLTESNEDLKDDAVMDSLKRSIMVVSYMTNIKDDQPMTKAEKVQQELLEKIAQKAFNKWKDRIKRSKERTKIRFYEPTYRLEPKQKPRIDLILKRCKSTLETLLRKNEKYDVNCTPIFIKVASEIIKSEIKKFNYERYKIVVFMIALQKVVSQSCLMTSAAIWNHETDKEIVIKMDTKSYYIVCDIFLSYCD